MELKSKKKLTDLSVKSSKKSNISKLSSSLARLASPIRPKKEGSGNQKFVEKNKSTSKLIQMSINIESDTISMKKSPVSRKSGIGKVFTPLGKIIRGSFVTPAPSTSRVRFFFSHEPFDINQLYPIQLYRMQRVFTIVIASIILFSSYIS